MSALTDAQLESFREQLTARQALLREEVRHIKEEQADAPSQMSHDQLEDAGEVGEEHVRHAVRHAELERDQLELRDVDDALARLRAGDYGECMDCGIDIPLKRLQAQPAARRCVKCQEAFEHAHPNSPRISASL
jgi:RNA polymerase-binding protein DksA